MHTIELPFKETKNALHLVLNPDDISNVSVVLRVARRVITKEPPWDTPKAEEGSLQIIRWLEALIESSAKLQPVKVPSVL